MKAVNLMEKGNAVTRIAMCAVLATTVCCGTFALEAQGPQQAEAAQHISLNKSVSGTNTDLDGDEYTFTMPKKGYVQVEAKSPEDEADVGFYTKNLNVRVGSVDYGTTTIGNADKFYASPKYCFAPGKRVAIKIVSTLQDLFGTYGKKYKLRVVNKGRKNFETERNDAQSSASKLKTGKSIKGVLNDFDTDCYVFRAPKKGKYKITLQATSDGRVDAQVKQKGHSAVSAYDYYGTPSTTLVKKTLRKGKPVRIKLTAGYGDNINYSVTVKKLSK